MVYLTYTMSKPNQDDVLKLQRIRTSTRAKLLRLASAQDRSPVAVLDRLVSRGLRDHGIDPDTLEPMPTGGTQPTEVQP